MCGPLFVFNSRQHNLYGLIKSCLNYAYVTTLILAYDGRWSGIISKLFKYALIPGKF